MSIDANSGDRIKISPATSGVSALPPTVSLFYEITESLTNIDPPDPPPSGDVGSSFDPLTGTWEPYSTLRDLAAPLNDGDTLDLTGRGFAPADLTESATGLVLDPNKSITIKGAFLSGAVYDSNVYNWTEGANGVWEADISSSGISDAIKAGNANRHLVDWDADEEVYSQQYPDFPENWPVYEFDHSANPSYLTHDRSDQSFLLDNIVTGNSDTVSSFRIIDQDTIDDFEDYLTDGSFGKNILWKMTPNVSGATLISSVQQTSSGDPITLTFESNIGGDYKNPETIDRETAIQVINGQDKYLINGRPTYNGSGVVSKRLELIRGNTYVFDWSGTPTHPLKFATAADAAGGTEYTTGVVFDAPNFTTTITVDYNAPQLYYYSTGAAGLGEYVTFKDPTNDYIGFAFHGADDSRLAAGEFCIDAEKNKVRYRPVKIGEPVNAGIASMYKAVDAVMAVGKSAVFEECTFSNFAPGNTTGQIYAFQNAGEKLSCTRCVFDHGKEAVRGNGKFYFCDFFKFSQRTLGSTGPGLVVEDCSFRAGGGTNSAILAQGILAGEENRIRIERNYFSISKSTHGQGVSLYKDSWQNALVKDNIFHNCKVALTYQHNKAGALDTLGDGYALAVENNLHFVDNVYTPDGVVNQPSLCQVVQQMDSRHLEGLNPIVRFRHNSLMYDPSVFIYDPDDFPKSADRWRLAGMLHYDGFQDCDVYYEGQITGYRTCGDGDGGSTRNFLNNMIFDSRGNGGAVAYVNVEDWWMDATRAQYDVDKYLDFNTLRPKAALAGEGCSAQDGGDVGARFTGLTAADLSTLKAGWAATFPPVDVPNFVANNFALGTGDNGRATSWDYFTDYSEEAERNGISGTGTLVQILDPNP